jgi:hypothetical protein
MFFLRSFWNANDNNTSKVTQRWQTMLLNERDKKETKDLNECRILAKGYITEMENLKAKQFATDQKQELRSRKEDYEMIVPILTLVFKTYQIEKFKVSASD